jgi:hypothetical protein
MSSSAISRGVSGSLRTEANCRRSFRSYRWVNYLSAGAQGSVAAEFEIFQSIAEVAATLAAGCAGRVRDGRATKPSIAANDAQTKS